MQLSKVVYSWKGGWMRLLGGGGAISGGRRANAPPSRSRNTPCSFCQPIFFFFTLFHFVAIEATHHHWHRRTRSTTTLVNGLPPRSLFRHHHRLIVLGSGSFSCSPCCCLLGHSFNLSTPPPSFVVLSLLASFLSPFFLQFCPSAQGPCSLAYFRCLPTLGYYPRALKRERKQNLQGTSLLES